MIWYTVLYFMNEYCFVTLWTNIVKEDDLVHWFLLYERILFVRMNCVHWFVLYERILLMEDDLVHWFLLSEWILSKRMTWYIGVYFMNEYCKWGRLGPLVCTLWTIIVNDDVLVHWFVLYERIFLMRITWYTGLYFLNENLFVRITLHTGLYFLNAYCLWG